MVNLFGKGFIGTQYTKMFSCIVNERNDLYPKSNEILYFISTTDNYTFKNNAFIDIETNLTTLMRVLEKCKNNCTVFNFVSSWYVYGGGCSVDEEHTCNPQGFYSITKRTAEQLLIDYCKEFNIKYRIIRLSNVVGRNDNSTYKKNVLGYLIEKIKNNKPIELHDNGKFFRTYIHVEDACSAINLILCKGNLNDIYNVGAYSATLFDATKYLIDRVKSKSEIINVDNTVLSFTMNNQKIIELGFKPKYNFSQMLDDLIDEYN